MKRYRRLWIILILSALTIFGLIRLGDIDLNLETLRRISWGWYGLVFVAYYASLISRGWRWHTILNAMGQPVTLLYATTLMIAGLFVSAILPARAGDIGRIAMLKQDHEIPVTQSLASIASERALDVFSILLMAMLSAGLVLPGRVPAEVSHLIVGVTILFIGGLAGLFLMPVAETWLREFRLLKKLLPDRLWTIYQKLLDFGFSLIHAVRNLAKNPAFLVVLIAQSFLIWLWDGLIVYAVLQSMNIGQPFSVSLFTAMISALAIAVPITPGALGQFEAAFITLLTLFGLTTNQGSLAALLLRGVQLWTFIPIGGLITYIFGFSQALNMNRTDVTPSAAPAPAEG